MKAGIEMNREKNKFSQSGGWTTRDHTFLHYTLRGQGPALVFIHGWSGSSQDFDGISRRLSKDYTTLIYDQRGHGESGRPEKGYKLSQLAFDLEQLLESLCLFQVVLVGYSMGGAVVLEYLRRFGSQRLCGILLVEMSPKFLNDENWDLGLYRGSYTKEDGLKDLQRMEEDFDGFYLDFLKHMLPHLEDKKIRAMMDIRRKTLLLPSKDALIRLWEELLRMDYREDLRMIELPTEIFWGEHSFYSKKSALYLESHLKNARLVVFKECSHQLILENPQAFEREIRRFMIENQERYHG